MRFIPTDGEYINEIDRMNEIETNINENLDNTDGDDTPGTTPESTLQGNLRKRKKIFQAKEGSTVTLSKQLDRLCDSVDGKNDESSITKMIKMLRGIPEIERGNQEFKPYDDDDDKLPSDDEEENATQDVYEERRSNHEMDKERDSIATLLMLR
ncbi:hypothetical protein EZV62_002323 [Acer yangbiense]|uniref:Uncharacterized protein n=1 Tax=Acer yangbiense TaxID=1000413 RepID=A0A5C7IXY1_9ROSI|nr:hypothetical protein EZV62_002323 [Acer yangbiense]